MSLPVEAINSWTTEPDRLGEPPVVVVGNGPVGMQFVRELLQRDPKARVVVYGSEPHLPYNRVQLSLLLAGNLPLGGLSEPLEVPDTALVEQRLGLKVVRIDTAARGVLDERGDWQPYSGLVLATGSRPHVPNLPGITLPGVFTFRDLNDASRLMARQVRSCHTVVLGGGLLGLEAARGMQRNRTRVTLVEHADRLMGHQLDIGASQLLQDQVQRLGIEVITADGVRRVLGSARVEGLELQSGRQLACDTLVVATGIRPNIELAQDAHVAWGQGIKVDDAMATSAPDVYAIGECAEHRGRIYGLVAPGLEQAAVAAAHFTGAEGRYVGSVAGTHLKVVDCPVFSVGPVAETDIGGVHRRHIYRKPDEGIYRVLLSKRGRMVGALGIGEWRDSRRLQIALAKQQRIMPWQLWRFLRTGSLWRSEDLTDCSAWPAAAPICQCKNVTRGAIAEAMSAGADNVARITQRTGAAGVCGSCRPLIQQLLGAGEIAAADFWRLLLGSSAVSLIMVAAMLLLPVIPFSQTVQVSWHWDELWRNGLLKQISGFSILGLFAVGLLVSPRKRVRALQKLGRFDYWRLLHVVLGVLVVLALLAHTGMRFGGGLDWLLMTSFVGTLLLGGISTAVIALEHKIGGAVAVRWRRNTVWWHILLFWPVPVVLGFHVLKTYFY